MAPPLSDAIENFNYDAYGEINAVRPRWISLVVNTPNLSQAPSMNRRSQANQIFSFDASGVQKHSVDEINTLQKPT